MSCYGSGAVLAFSCCSGMGVGNRACTKRAFEVFIASAPNLPLKNTAEAATFFYFVQNNSEVKQALWNSSSQCVPTVRDCSLSMQVALDPFQTIFLLFLLFCFALSTPYLFLCHYLMILWVPSSHFLITPVERGHYLSNWSCDRGLQRALRCNMKCRHFCAKWKWQIRAYKLHSFT